MTVDLQELTKLFDQHVKEISRAYDQILPKAGFDSVVIHSGSLKTRTDFDDQFWALRPIPHFQHWAPLAQPDLAVVYTVGKKPLLIWTQANSIWEKPAKPETEHFLGPFEVLRPNSVEKVKELLPHGDRVAYIGEDMARARSWGFENKEKINPLDVTGPLDRLRSKKTPYEVLCLAEANRKAALGHSALMQAFQSGDQSELELHLLFLKATNQDDPETPYKNIIALGESAAVLHHIDYKKRPEVKVAETLLVDAGACYQGYCSDITRTWVKGTGATMSTFKGIVDGLEKMQQELCAAVEVGNGYEKLHEESHRQVGNILRAAGIVRDMSGEAAYESGITRAFYPHGLGHSLGLQCHDVGCALIKPKPENPYLRNTSTITPGQCFTVEPGIYFIEGLLEELKQSEHAKSVDFKLVEALMPLGGVRIEDDLVVHEKGAKEKIRNLTRELLPVGGGLA
ncbi:MAG TPA: Xaa-Pro dipeptidase [Polyangiaceae bacterium]